MKTDKELHYRDNGTSKRLTVALVAVSAILLGLIVGYMATELVRGIVIDVKESIVERHEIVFGNVEDSPLTARDLERETESTKANSEMPIYLQTNSTWVGLPYGDSTIGESGCGLTVAAMTIEHFLGVVCTPDSLAGAVGDSCLVYSNDGTLVNDMSRFGEFCVRTYRFSVSEQYWNVETALNSVRGDSNVVWAGVSGMLGEKFYNGHVVALYRVTDTHVWLRDPDSAENSVTAFPIDYVLNNVDWQYFYNVKGGE